MSMKKLLMALTVVFILYNNGFAGNNQVNKTGKPVVSVSILPQKYFVEQIAGNFCNINVILPPGSSPEDYEPAPKQLIEVANSDIFFYMGHLGFEKSWMKKIARNAPNVDFISCSKGIDLLRETCNKEDREHDADENLAGTDPHIWTSPENVKIISRTICSELSKKYPAEKKVFETNLASFISKIDTLDVHIRQMFSDSIKTSFMIFHPSLGYFARDYHLTQYAVEFEGKSPSTAHMKAMVDLARKEKINTIFIQSQFETAKASAIAREIRASVVTVDPLAVDWLSEMYSIGEKMKKALAVPTHEKTN